MSLVSSVLSSRRHRPSTSSSRPSGWRINIRLAPLMDSLTALASGLLLRFCIDTVGRHDFKLTGTLVGLWEGVVLLHFLKKAPRSSDPYIGFGLRLFVDFMFTESVARLVLVCIWTALGMVLADIVPAVWDESGLRRVWRGVRRDLYRLGEMVPTVAFFPPARTVRFSPSRVPSSVITEEEAPTELPDTTSIPDPSISVLTTDQTQSQSPAPLSSTIEPVSTTTPVAQEILRRRVPGHFPSGYSDTDTEIGSPRGPAPHSHSHSRSRSAGRTARRLSVYPGDVSLSVDLDTSSELSSTGAPEDEELDDDLDEANRSSLSGSTERGDGEGDTTLNLNLNIEEVPEMPVEEQEALLVDTASAAAAQGRHEPEEGELTPKQRSVPFYMPPTPSDSAARVHRNRRILEDREREDKDPISLPPSDQLPQIPDFLEESNTEDWKKIQKEEADVDAERPPTPPEKDRPVSSVPANNAGNTSTTLPVPPPKRTQTQTQTPSPDATANLANANDDTNDPDPDGWDTLDSQFLSNPNTNTTNDNTHIHTHSREAPPAYQSFDYDDTNHDDIYDDPPPAKGQSSTSFDPQQETFDLFGPGPGGEAEDPWKAEAEAKRKAEEEAKAETQRLAEEAEAKRKAAEEAEARRIAEAAEARRKAEEAEAWRIAQEAEARRIAEEKAAAAEALKLKKAEETAERKRKEAADEATRQKKRLEEEAARKVREEEERKAREEERKKQEEEERKRLKEEKKLLKLEKARLEEEERKRLEEEERKKQEEERLRLEEEERLRLEEEERKRHEKEEADRKEKEAREVAEAEAEARRVKEEEEARQLEAQEQARLQAQREEAERQQQAADEAAAVQPQPQERATQFESEQQEAEDEGEPPQVAAHPAPTTESANPLQTADDAPTEQPNGAGEASQPPAGPDADPLSAPAPAPEHQEAADADADAEHQPPVADADADAEQHPAEHQTEPAFDPHEVESVITEASQVPDKVAERLSNIILLKAQMAEVEEQIGELRRELEGAAEGVGEGVDGEEKARLEAELRVKEKILRKMQRKEVRRREEMPAPKFADGKNDSSLDKLGPRDAEIKIEEKLEQLLEPGVKSLSCAIKAQAGQAGKKQMPNINNLLVKYCLFDYTTADRSNQRWLTVEVPEYSFNAWLKAYRTSVTQANEEDSDFY